MRRADHHPRFVTRALRRGPAALGLAIALVVGLSGGAAWAFLTAAGSGSGTTTIQTLTVTGQTPGTPTSLLLPGGTGTLVLRLTSSTGAKIVRVAEAGSQTTSTVATCDVSVTTQTLAGSPISVTQGTHPLVLASAVAMADGSPSSCQTKTFSIKVTLTMENA